ncbi:MAG: DUF2975 domain-containing protein [Ruminococcus sp.]|nr:DUF2975 domain-containing protein [Ruminococcus sp.]
MENSVKRKINVFGKVMKIITTVIIVCLLVAEGFMLVGGVIVAIVPKDSVTVDAAVNADIKVNTGYFGLDDGQVSVKAGDTKIVVGDIGSGDFQINSENGVTHMNSNFRDMHFDLNTALLLIVYGMVSLAAVIVALYFFKALMKQFMICDSPFSDGVVQKMRHFAIALIPCVVVAEGMKKAIGGVISDSFTFDFDFISVAFVFIIFVLTMVFKYGTELQKEHDDMV